MTREQPRRDMGAHTEGNVNTAGVNDAAGASSTDGGVVGRLARASVVAEGAVGGRGGGVADAGNGALREVGGALGGHNGGEGSDSDEPVLARYGDYWYKSEGTKRTTSHRDGRFVQQATSARAEL
ncbi:hypothetical protein HYQ46_003239 [Verticillium longisporum]|nr:hypothetical protein HYQ46_003239 [Verticillium longisporum]